MQITTGKVKSAQKIVIYAPEGLGKSTIASTFPEPVFIDTEGSTKHLDVARTPTPNSWPMLMEQLIWLADPTNHDFKTVVIDTLDWAERLANKFVCQRGNVKNLPDLKWGKGYDTLAEEMGTMLDFCTNIVNSGTNVVLLAHCHVRTMTLPEEDGNFDKYELKLQKKVAPLPKEWGDGVFFANYKTILSSDGQSNKKKATGGRRYIYTSHRSSYDGKNRYELPHEIDFENNPRALIEALGNNIPIRANNGAQQTVQEPVNETPIQQEEANPTQQENQTAQKSEIPETPSPQVRHALFDLIEQQGVSVQEIEEQAVTNGHFPKGMPMKEYPIDYLTHLLNDWTQVFETITELRNKKEGK